MTATLPTTEPVAPSAAAERMRRHRQRRRDGLRCFMIELRETEIDALIRKGLLAAEKLLQSVGFKEPDDVSIQAAIEANDKFIDDLQAIHQRAQQLTLE